MAILSSVFQVASTQKWFTIAFFWGRPGTMQLAQGHTGWLYSQEAQWESDSETYHSAA